MTGERQTFIITSVIYFSDRKLSYSSVRSIFSPQERGAQTLKTITSIRKKAPDADVILLEMGGVKEIPADLLKAVDKYVFVGNNPLVRWACNGIHKGLGEAMGLIVSRKELNTDSDFYFKISGRYFLNDDFDPAQWKGSSLMARKYGSAISTRLYGFGQEARSHWQKALRKSLLPLYRGRSIEEVLPEMFGKDAIKSIEKLGVSGFVAPQGEYLTE